MRNLVLGLAGLALLGGCKVDAPAADTRTEEVTMHYAGADMAGKTVDMKVGEILRVELESIPTAGYLWIVTSQPEFLELAGENTRPTDPEVQNQPGFTGGNHYLSFDFTATAPGTGTLDLVEGRPWELEAGEAPEGTWSIRVSVAAEE
ncbi:MAG: protease inhibitor I42 family protein [Hyphomonas sp.]|uniref:protease inhibitor I42 family protein n=1 Tax=Hyphomonas sp. TaxID=87 RepID=UPI003526EA67